MEPRSCGSTLKPFLYLSAIDQRKLTAGSLLPDTPDAISAEYRDYDPQNYSKRYLGPVRVREALGSSLNVPAVFALSQIGARETFEYLKSWRLNFPGSFDAYGAGFILGNAPVRLLDLAAAYASLARGGEVWIPRFTPKDPIREPAPGFEGSLCDHCGYLVRQSGEAGGLRRILPVRPATTHCGENRHQFRVSRRVVRGIQQGPHRGSVGRQSRWTADERGFRCPLRGTSLGGDDEVALRRRGPALASSGGR